MIGLNISAIITLSAGLYIFLKDIGVLSRTRQPIDSILKVLYLERQYNSLKIQLDDF